MSLQNEEICLEEKGVTVLHFIVVEYNEILGREHSTSILGMIRWGPFVGFSFCKVSSQTMYRWCCTNHAVRCKVHIRMQQRNGRKSWTTETWRIGKDLMGCLGYLGMFSTIWLAHDPWLMLLDRLWIDVFLDWLDFLPYAIWLQKTTPRTSGSSPSFHWMKTSCFSLKKYQFSYMFWWCFTNFNSLSLYIYIMFKIVFL